MNRKPILFALVVLGLVALSSCGGGSSSPGILIQLTNVPGTLTVNQTVSLSATISNDTGAGNVNWTCSPSGSCGTFNPTTTSNGGTTSYTAPAAAGTVTITATDADHSSATTNASISVVSVGSNGQLKGNYVYFVEGSNVNGLYFATGTIVADGSGNINSGEQDYFDASGLADTADPLTGTYSISGTGIGSITLALQNTLLLPNGGNETFSIGVTSSSHALVIEFDGNDTSSGTLDLQYQGSTPITASQIAGAYSFAFNGEDLSTGAGLTFGGFANLSAATGSVTTGTIYRNDGGALANGSAAGSVTGPDSFGRGTVTMSGYQFVYYAVQGAASTTQSGVLRVAESDAASTGFLSGGAIYSQGTPGANSTFSDTSLKGTATFFESGSSVNGALSLAGQFTADGAGNFSAGYADTNDDGDYQKGSIAGEDVYAISSNGSGTMTLPGTGSTTEDVSALLIFATDPNLNLNDPNNSTGGGGALIVDNDSGAYGTGLIVPQTTGAFQGNYAVNLQFFNSGGEEDFVGQSVASGGSLSGSVDLNDSGTTASGTMFSGSSSADSTNVGRYTGSFTVGANSYHITYYQVSSGEFFIVDTDSGDVGNGFMQTQ